MGQNWRDEMSRDQGVCSLVIFRHVATNMSIDDVCHVGAHSIDKEQRIDSHGREQRTCVTIGLVEEDE